MTYTYDDFVTAANTAGLMEQFTESDLKIAQKDPTFGISLLSLLKDGSSATTAEQRLLATEAANQLRKSYGTDAVQIGVADHGSFQYANDEAYRKALQDVVGQGSFSFDLENDPAWEAYRKMYTREGDRASANALAQASAASGGIPSSYAQTVAQQAGNYFAAQLGDVIPTLEQNAYARYLNDFNNSLNKLSSLSSDRAFDFDAWLQQYQTAQATQGIPQYGVQTDGQAVPGMTVTPTDQGNAGEISGGNTGEISSSMLAALKQTYPDGNVANYAYWKSLLNLYGADKLAAAGFRYGTGRPENGGTVANRTPTHKNALV